MKHLQSKQEFLTIKQINEGLFSKLFKGIANLYTKVKGGKELQQVKDLYKNKIKAVFDNMAKAEQSKTAAKQNVKTGVEEAQPQQPNQTATGKTNASFSFDVSSKLYEAETETTTNAQTQPVTKQTQPVTATQQKPEAAQPKQQNTQPDETNPYANLSQEQLAQITKNAQAQISTLITQFRNQVAALKKKLTDKDGNLPKSLEYSIALAEAELSDYNFEQWQNYYTQIGNNDAVGKVQKQRAGIAKKIKENSKNLQQAIEGKDIAKKTFEVGKKYHYTNSKGEDKVIVVDEVDEQGNVKTATVEGDNVTINPYTNKIGDKVEEPAKEEPKKEETTPKAQTQTAQQPKTQTQTA